MALVYHPLALREKQDAAQAYEDEVPGMGDRFLDEIDRALEILDQFPESGALIDDGIRRLGFRRFPYNLVYQQRGNDLFIAAIIHHRREPFYWRDRL